MVRSRRVVRLSSTLLLAAAVGLGCSGSSAPSPAGDGSSTGGGSGGGTGATGGTGGTGDGGGVIVVNNTGGGGGGGGAAGGGAGGGGAAGGGSPALPAARVEVASGGGECGGVVPASVPAAVSYGFTLAPGATCIGGSTDGDGRVALGAFDASLQRYSYAALEANATFDVVFWADGLAPLRPQAHGYHSVEVLSDRSAASHKLVDGQGVTRRTTPLTGRGGAVDVNVRTAIAGLPGGGSFVAVERQDGQHNHFWNVDAWRFAADGTPAGPIHVLDFSSSASPSAVAAGASSAGPGLVLWNASGQWSGSWVNGSGPASSVFDLVGVRGDGPMEAFALLDGSIALRFQGTWLGALPPGATALSPAPGWVSSLGAASPAILPGSRGYAVLPAPGASAAACEQRVELRAPSGALCGAVVFRYADAACTTKEIDLGADGTVVQQSPIDACPGGACACTHAWWPGVLR